RVITEVTRAKPEYGAGSATANGQLVGNQIQWSIPVLKSGDSFILEFRVKVSAPYPVVNSSYAVSCAEGVTTIGPPITTTVSGGGILDLPNVRRGSPKR